MIRKLILALGVLAVTALPAVPAQAQEHWRHWRGERFDRHERFEPRFFFGFHAPGFAFYGPGFYVPAPTCTYEPGHWVTQPYVDAYGNYTYAERWVPGHNICG
ncbi:MAG TPA: hypothetical protein VFO18_00840 [Methylomirabilota bacterium]|nr:hypothetical protein [Methylomirabilota bacterium]